MEEMFISNEAEDTVIGVFILSRLVGCAPVKKNFDKVYAAIVYSVIFVSIFCGLDILYILRYISVISRQENNEAKEIILTFLLSNVKTCLFAVVFVLSSLKVGKVKNVLDVCKDIDKILNKFNSFKPYDIRYFRRNVLYKFFFLMLSLCARLYIVKFKEGFIQLFLHLPLILTQHASICQYEILTLILHSRLKLINLTLKNCFSNNKYLNVKEKETLALHLTNAHFKAVSISGALNDIYSFQLLVYCLNIFFVLILTTFDLVQSLISAWDGKQVGKQWIESLPLFVQFVIMLWTLIRSSEKLTDQSAEFNETLYRVLKEDRSVTLINNELFVTHIKTKRTIIMTAWDLFNLDRDLALAIAGAITTYYVIVKDVLQI